MIASILAAVVMGVFVGLLIIGLVCLTVSRLTERPSMWHYVFVEPWIALKWWICWKLEPWYEERASLDLEWRIFAQKHNAAGHRPLCLYKGMEKDLKPTDKLELYEFPDHCEDIDPAYLQKAHWDAAKEKDKRSQVT